MMKLLKLLFSTFHESETNYILSSEVLPSPLSKEEEEKCLIEMKKGNIEAKHKLMEHNLRLVVYIAKRYDSNPNNMEDLISIGTFGLIKAIDTFQMEKSYFYLTI